MLHQLASSRHPGSAPTKQPALATAAATGLPPVASSAVRVPSARGCRGPRRCCHTARRRARSPPQRPWARRTSPPPRRGRWSPRCRGREGSPHPRTGGGPTAASRRRPEGTGDAHCRFVAALGGEESPGQGPGQGEGCQKPTPGGANQAATLGRVVRGDAGDHDADETANGGTAEHPLDDEILLLGRVGRACAQHQHHHAHLPNQLHTASTRLGAERLCRSTRENRVHEAR